MSDLIHLDEETRRVNAQGLPLDSIAGFCKRRHIRKLALFGSVLREDFYAESDVDVLVEYESEHVPGLAFFSD